MEALDNAWYGSLRPLTNLTQTFQACHLCTFNVAAIFFFRGHPYIWRTTIRRDKSRISLHAPGWLLHRYYSKSADVDFPVWIWDRMVLQLCQLLLPPGGTPLLVLGWQWLISRSAVLACSCAWYVESQYGILAWFLWWSGWWVSAADQLSACSGFTMQLAAAGRDGRVYMILTPTDH